MHVSCHSCMSAHTFGAMEKAVLRQADMMGMHVQAILVNEQRALANQEQQNQIQQLERKCYKHERSLATLRSEKAELRSRFSSMDGLTSEHATMQAQVRELDSIPLTHLCCAW